MATEKFLLTLSGFYPLDKFNIFHYLSRFINFTISIILLITFTFEIILTEDLMNSMDTLKVFVIHIFFVAKLIVFMFNSKRMKNVEILMQNKLFNLHNNNNNKQYCYIRDVIDNTALIGNIYRICCTFYVVSSTMIGPILNRKDRQVAMAGRYGFDTKKYFVEVSIFQAIALSISAYNNSSIDILNTRLIAMASAQFDVLIDNLRNSVPTECNDKTLFNRKVEDRLKLCVQHHEIIIE